MSKNNPSPPTYDELQAQLVEANAKIALVTTQKLEADADEKIIAAKMERGLTRPQATAVVRRQKEYDASALAQKQTQRQSVNK